MSQPDDYFQAGFRHFKDGNMDAAIEDLKAALATEADHSEAWRTLGMAHYRKEEFEEALACAEKLVELLPKDAVSHSTHSLFLMKVGRIEDAEEAAARARVMTWKKDLKDRAAGEGGNELDVLEAQSDIQAPISIELPAAPDGAKSEGANETTPDDSEPSPDMQ